MNEYEINGKTIVFDVFDLDNYEKFENASNYFNDISSKIPDSSGADKMRFICNKIIEFFDSVVGEGTSQDIFGGRVNAKECIQAYISFTTKVIEDINSFTKDFNKDLSLALSESKKAK